jgi:hypothetical protein
MSKKIKMKVLQRNWICFWKGYVRWWKKNICQHLHEGIARKLDLFLKGIYVSPWLKYFSTPSWRYCLQPPGSEYCIQGFNFEIVFMLVLSILHDQNKIKIRCNTRMWVLHDGSTRNHKYEMNSGIAFGCKFLLAWSSASPLPFWPN